MLISNFSTSFSDRVTDMLQSGKILRKILREKAKIEVGDKDPAQAKL